jgi:hypothetical protein
LFHQFIEARAGRPQAFCQPLALARIHSVQRGLNAAKRRVYVINVVNKSDQFSSGCHDESRSSCLIGTCGLKSASSLFSTPTGIK